MNAPQIKVLRSFIKWAKASFKAGDTLPEAERAEIHALTRKVTISNEDLMALENTITWHTTTLNGNISITSILRDLRDRYEERGKYAPQ